MYKYDHVKGFPKLPYISFALPILNQSLNHLLTCWIILNMRLTFFQFSIWFVVKRIIQIKHGLKWTGFRPQISVQCVYCLLKKLHLPHPERLHATAIEPPVNMGHLELAAPSSPKRKSLCINTRPCIFNLLNPLESSRVFFEYFVIYHIPA